MKRILYVLMLLCISATLSAQGMLMRVTLKDGTIGTPNTEGLYVIDTENVDHITFIAKPIDGNPEHVKLVNTSNIEWSTINYGATSPEDEGTKLAWSADDVVFNNWTVPDQENRKWRMPTVDDLEELIYFCDWEPSDDGKGYWVYNRDDHEKRIYLPSTVNYWSSSQDGNNKAEALLFSNGPQQLSTNRLSQYAIRPVWGDPAFSATVRAEVISTSFYGAVVRVNVAECSDESKIAGYGVSGDVAGESATNPAITLTGLTPGQSYSVKGYVKAQGISQHYESEAVTFTTPQKTLSVTATVVPSSHEAATATLAIAGNAAESVSYTLEYWKSGDDGNKQSKSGSVTLTGTAAQSTVVALDGLGNAEGTEQDYQYRVTVRYDRENYAETQTEGSFTTPRKSKYKIPTPVNLGLSVQWADINIGAEVDTDPGGYFGFGDPEGDMTVTSSGYYAQGKLFTTIGGDPAYDIAAKQFGGNWRLPTCAEVEELASCNPTFATKEVIKDGVRTNVSGWVLTGIGEGSGNTIFIPCAGVRQGETLNTVADLNRYAYLWTDSVAEEGICYSIMRTPERWTVSKARGLSIRAVYDDGSHPKPNPNQDLTNEIVEGSDQNEESGIIPKAGVDMGTKYVVTENGIQVQKTLYWSRWNIGVKKKTGEYGKYFAWGETAPKGSYTNDTYNVPFKTTDANDMPNFGFSADYDAAVKLWKDDWRMPTAGEIATLVNNCTSEWVQEDGLWGYRLTSKTTGNTLFFPAGGSMNGTQNEGRGERGSYWSASGVVIGDAGKKTGWATSLYFSYPSIAPKTEGNNRYKGMLIRPVKTSY